MKQAAVATDRVVALQEVIPLWLVIIVTMTIHETRSKITYVHIVENYLLY